MSFIDDDDYSQHTAENKREMKKIILETLESCMNFQFNYDSFLTGGDDAPVCQDNTKLLFDHLSDRRSMTLNRCGSCQQRN